MGNTQGSTNEEPTPPAPPTLLSGFSARLTSFRVDEGGGRTFYTIECSLPPPPPDGSVDIPWSWLVEREYHDFCKLHSTLKAQGCHAWVLPDLPRWHLFRRDDNIDVIDERMAQLPELLRAVVIAAKRGLLFGREVVDFLDCTEALERVRMPTVSVTGKIQDTGEEIEIPVKQWQPIYPSVSRCLDQNRVATKVWFASEAVQHATTSEDGMITVATWEDWGIEDCAVVTVAVTRSDLRHAPSFSGPLFSGTVPGAADGRCVRNYEQTLEHDPDSIKTWTELGIVGGGTVAGTHYSQRECLEVAVALDPTAATVAQSIIQGLALDGIPPSADLRMGQQFCHLCTPVPRARCRCGGWRANANALRKSGPKLECIVPLLSFPRIHSTVPA